MKTFTKIILFPIAIGITAASSFAQNGGPGACGFNSSLSKDHTPLPLDGNQLLGQIYNVSNCGLNWVHGDVLIETRTQAYGFNTTGTGLPTTINITGIPSCNVIERAYLWYFASFQSASAPSTSVNITNPIGGNNIYPGNNPVGLSGDVCWQEVGTAVYRADVTTNISGNGNYAINITGFTNPNWEVDGATLLIIYRDLGATYQGSMVINDGNMACGAFNAYANPQSSTMSNVNACANSTFGQAFAIVADMQGNINGGNHPATLNGVVGNYPNNFWCFDQTNTTVTAGQATAQFQEDGLGLDCYIFGVMGLYYQTTTCTTCVPTSLSVNATGVPTACNGNNGSATATATGPQSPFTYLWSNGATTTSISNLAPGNYTITVTDAVGCVSTDTVNIAASTGPAVTFTTTAASCNGASDGTATVTASGGVAPYTYAWTTNPVQATQTATGLAAGTYSVFVSDATGCSATYTTSITQPTAVTLTATVVNNALCNGIFDGSATATAGGGTGPYNYLWSNGQATQTSTGLAAGNYSVTATDAAGCTTVQSVTITEPAPIILSQTTTTASCGIADGSATVTAAGGTAPYSYIWLTTPVQSTQTINNIPTGVYNVLVTDVNGCNQTMTINVPSLGPPVADFIFYPETVDLLDASILFTDLSSNANTWLWDFGDPLNPSASVQQNPSHTYTDTGMYCITLIIVDPGGVCKDTITKCIRVKAPFTFYVPNAFTPNGDGFNEMFMAMGTYIKTFDLDIFDRWGNHIFESTDIMKGWDGKVKDGPSNKISQEDVYVWKIRITDANNKQHNYIGHVNLVK